MKITFDLKHISITNISVFCAILSIAIAKILITQIFIFKIYYSIATIASILLLIYTKNKLFLVPTLIALCSTIIGYQIHSAQKVYDFYTPLLNRPTTINGTITDIQIATLEKATSNITIKINSLYSEKKYYTKLPGHIFIQMPLKRAYHAEIGDTIIIYGLLLTQIDPASEYHYYFLRNDIYATSFLSKERFFYKKKSTLKQSFLQKIKSHLSQKTAQLFFPLFLGKKERSKENRFIQKQSLYWGIAHHMARSGIHLVMILLLLTTLLNWLQINYKVRSVLIMSIATLYHALSFNSLSFMRAMSMQYQQAASKIVQTQYSSIHALAITTIGTVFYNPYHVLFLDFQLSFGITAVIIWLFRAKYSKTVDNKVGGGVSF